MPGFIAFPCASRASGRCHKAEMDAPGWTKMHAYKRALETGAHIANSALAPTPRERSSTSTGPAGCRFTMKARSSEDQGTARRLLRHPGPVLTPARPSVSGAKCPATIWGPHRSPQSGTNNSASRFVEVSAALPSFVMPGMVPPA